PPNSRGGPPPRHPTKPPLNKKIVCSAGPPPPAPPPRPTAKQSRSAGHRLDWFVAQLAMTTMKASFY
ncbi:hypothetical protein P3G22_29410, partial [Rhodopseudomonas sp. BAL398]|nr:hypothetical protein [Rhodopseudomonas sp. BAL398]